MYTIFYHTYFRIFFWHKRWTEREPRVRYCDIWREVDDWRTYCEILRYAWPVNDFPTTSEVRFLTDPQQKNKIEKKKLSVFLGSRSLGKVQRISKNYLHHLSRHFGSCVVRLDANRKAHETSTETKTKMFHILLYIVRTSPLKPLKPKTMLPIILSSILMSY